jgi:hypothetical protein
MKNRVGEKHPILGGDWAEIVEYFHCKNCTIKLKNEELIYNIAYNNFKKGTTNNPYNPTVCGVGYTGVGKYYFKGYKKAYKTWANMLLRGYDEKYKLKNTTYKDCSVDEFWHNFQNFAKWFEENYNPETMQGWDFDKDILIKGNKIYSPDTCVFVPKEINRMFAKNKVNRGEYPVGMYYHKKAKKIQVLLTCGDNSLYLGLFDTIEEAFQAYKTAKEDYIKEVAEKWKNQIAEETYNALINYKVEITD